MKKSLQYIVLLVGLIGWQVSARAQVLYEISGNSAKAKSYLLGTNEIVDMAFADTIPNAFACFARCDKVLTPFAFQDYEAIAALRTAALLPDSVVLSNFYTEAEWERLGNAVQLRLNIAMSALARMKPAYIAELLLTDLYTTYLHADQERSIDRFFSLVAAEKGIPVYPIDDLGETLYMLFDREPIAHQCLDLLKIVDYPEREVAQARRLVDMYRNGRLADMAFAITSPDNKTSFSYSDYQVFAARNRAWVGRLAPYLSDGRAFITVPAAYLGGEKGLIACLREKGYRVRAVNRR